ncbi:hypothetical protein DMENIID0001_054700 [Sergentomyia squamirostris]
MESVKNQEQPIMLTAIHDKVKKLFFLYFYLYEVQFIPSIRYGIIDKGRLLVVPILFTLSIFCSSWHLLYEVQSLEDILDITVNVNVYVGAIQIIFNVAIVNIGLKRNHLRVQRYFERIVKTSEEFLTEAREKHLSKSLQEASLVVRSLSLLFAISFQFFPIVALYQTKLVSPMYYKFPGIPSTSLFFYPVNLIGQYCIYYSTIVYYIIIDCLFLTYLFYFRGEVHSITAVAELLSHKENLAKNCDRILRSIYGAHKNLLKEFGSLTEVMWYYYCFKFIAIIPLLCTSTFVYARTYSIVAGPVLQIICIALVNLLCVPGQLIDNCSDKLRETLYQTLWYEMKPKEQKKFLLIFVGTERYLNTKTIAIDKISFSTLVQMITGCLFPMYLFYFRGEVHSITAVAELLSQKELVTKNCDKILRSIYGAHKNLLDKFRRIPSTSFFFYPVNIIGQYFVFLSTLLLYTLTDFLFVTYLFYFRGEVHSITAVAELLSQKEILTKNCNGILRSIYGAHRNLLEEFGSLTEVMWYYYFHRFFAIIPLLCTSTFVYSRTSSLIVGPVLQMITFVLVLLLCVPGQLTGNCSDDLQIALYQSVWYEMKPKDQRNFLLIFVATERHLNTKTIAIDKITFSTLVQTNFVSPVYYQFPGIPSTSFFFYPVNIIGRYFVFFSTVVLYTLTDCLFVTYLSYFRGEVHSITAVAELLSQKEILTKNCNGILRSIYGAHKNLLEEFRSLTEVMWYYYCHRFIAIVPLLCTSTFAYSRISSLIVGPVLQMVTFVLVLLLCVPGQLTDNCSNDLQKTLYQSFWYEMKPKDQKTFLLIFVGTERYQNTKTIAIDKISFTTLLQTNFVSPVYYQFPGIPSTSFFFYPVNIIGQYFLFFSTVTLYVFTDCLILIYLFYFRGEVHSITAVAELLSQEQNVTKNCNGILRSIYGAHMNLLEEFRSLTELMWFYYCFRFIAIIP